MKGDKKSVEYLGVRINGIAPARMNNIELLEPIFREKIRELLRAMKTAGFEPWLFETKRSYERQVWLYAQGRVIEKGKKPVTWTIESKHRSGEAADIIEMAKLWSDPLFFKRLKIEAVKLGLLVLKRESCHVEQK